MSNKLDSEIKIVEQWLWEFCGQQVVFNLDSLHCQKKQLNALSMVTMNI
jgi:hypothetical protein